jgi:hypothetical protein
MIYNCSKCGLSKSDGAMSSTLPQCKCDWNAAPPKKEWVSLTEEEIADMHHEIKVKGMGAYKTEDIYRTIEAKLKEKNHE